MQRRIDVLPDPDRPASVIFCPHPISSENPRKTVLPPNRSVKRSRKTAGG
jgi:hypothetical protein